MSLKVRPFALWNLCRLVNGLSHPATVSHWPIDRPIAHCAALLNWSEQGYSYSEKGNYTANRKPRDTLYLQLSNLRK